MNAIKNYFQSLRQTPDKTREMDALREAHAAASKELEAVQQELQRIRDADTQQIAELQLQLKSIKTAYDNVRSRTESLEHLLTDAEQRLKSTAANADLLQVKLEEERERHDASLHATESSLARMQEEQQSLLTQQSDLANSFLEVATRLLATMQTENEKPEPRYSFLQLLLIAGVFAVIGALVGLLYMQNRPEDNGSLAAVEQDIREMQLFMKQHIDKQDDLIKELSLGLNRMTLDGQDLFMEKLLAHEEQKEKQKQAQAQELEQEKATQPRQETISFTPNIEELQANLTTLGFDLGSLGPTGVLDIKTKQALREFKQFYLPHSDAQDDMISEPLVILVIKSADLARADAAHYSIGSDVLAAIRLGSMRTGVSFSFLMEMARVESNFDPLARAPKSSATGLYQFRRAPWLQSIRTYGSDYGLDDYVARLNKIEDRNGGPPPIVSDPLLQEVLALRLNPRLSTLMLAENIKHDLRYLGKQTGEAPDRTELYLAHFLGADGAISFLGKLKQEPDAIAAELFPQVAAENPAVFRTRQRKPRTLAEVYKWFHSKFYTGRYDVNSPG